MIRDFTEAKEELSNIRKFIMKQNATIVSLEDKITAQHELIHHLEMGVQRRDEIIRELQDQLEGARRP